MAAACGSIRVEALVQSELLVVARQLMRGTVVGSAVGMRVEASAVN